MYSIVYIITDNEELNFFNELMISASSLRYYNYDGPVGIVTNQQTAKILKARAEELEKYKLDLVIVDTPDNLTPEEASRYIKTTLREHVAGDYLFVDTDTIFSDKLPSYISDKEMAAVPDRHIQCLTPGTIPYDFCKKFYDEVGIENIEGKTYLNSGVLWVRDTEKTHEFYKKWYSNWQMFMNKGVFYDQLAFNYTDWQNGNFIGYLPDGYNVQVSTKIKIPFKYLSKAYIIHYFHHKGKAAVYLLSRKEYKTLRYDSEAICEIIASPKSAFVESAMLPADLYSILTNSKFVDMYIKFRMWYRKIRKSFRTKR